MNDPIKSFRLSNIVAMASNDSRSANGREVELLVRLVLLLLLLDFGPLFPRCSTHPGEMLAVTGSSGLLGSWQKDKVSFGFLFKLHPFAQQELIVNIFNISPIKSS